VPPRWSPCDWQEEARAQGTLAACEALRAFEPGRLVPLDAFLYHRVVASVWTRYRQEWSFGRRVRRAAALPDRAAAVDCPEPELVDRLAVLLQTLDEGERRLIRQLFWDGRTEDQLALELGITRQAVNKRKQRLLQRLRSDLRTDATA
jgi:DNA-directed RNA polymerase specialized sigma24 family protein